MQKLEQRTKRNTPRNASQVSGNCDLQLNRDQSLSVANLKTCSNNLDVNHSNTRRSIKSYVYVKSINGKPLMPCSQAKAIRMLKKGAARVIKRCPFTIQLNFKCKNKTQDITLGIDPGYLNVGFSAVIDKKELISGTMVLDNKTSERLTEKRMYRRNRRNRLWYRQPRFLNRGIKKGWLAPSIQRRLDSHIRLIEKLKKMLPINKIVVEVANFDIQKINNPDIKGVQYQQGSLYEYENLKAYIIAREQGKCQLCGKEFDKQGWHLHHIIPRNDKGTDKPDNIALLHKSCHKKLHKQKLFSKLKKARQFKAETFMSTIRWKIVEMCRTLCDDVNITFGNKTKVKRLELEIDKTHNNDAFVIADGQSQSRCLSYNIDQKHRNNRVLQLNRKGFKPSIKRQRYKIQPKDLIKVSNKIYDVAGMCGYGKSIRSKDDLDKPIYLPTKNITWHFMQKTFIWKLSEEKRPASSAS